MLSLPPTTQSTSPTTTTTTFYYFKEIYDNTKYCYIWQYDTMGVQRAQYLTSVSYTGQPQHQPLSLSLQRPPLPTSPITTSISHIPNNQSRPHCLALSSLLLSAPHDIQTISASRTAPTGTPSPNNDIII